MKKKDFEKKFIDNMKDDEFYDLEDAKRIWDGKKPLRKAMTLKEWKKLEGRLKRCELNEA